MALLSQAGRFDAHGDPEASVVCAGGGVGSVFHHVDGANRSGRSHAPGADDDASGVSVSVESARLLSKPSRAAHPQNRATLSLAAISAKSKDS